MLDFDEAIELLKTYREKPFSCEYIDPIEYFKEDTSKEEWKFNLKDVRGKINMAKFDNAKVGDRVFSIQYGLGTIDRFGTVNDHKVFKVDFDNGDYEWYFKDGRVNIDDVNPTLFWNEFHIPTEEDDKKPFDLVEYLKENLEPRDFRWDTNNIELRFSHKSNKWKWNWSVLNQSIGAVYFRERNNDILHYIVDILNQNKITPQQLRNAYRELGWL